MDETTGQDMTAYVQTLITADGNILSRSKPDFGYDWTEWESIVVSPKEVASNIQDGIADGSIQSTNSDAGAKVFRFDLEHEYTDEDISNKRYYLTYVVDEMLKKPFSIVLGENYDFLGTITSVVHNESGSGGYITVDNYKAPTKVEEDTRTAIYEDSYIILPYNYIDNSDSYTYNQQYVNEGAHMLGNSIIGTNGTAFGYDSHALSIGSFAAGYKQNAAGKYAATFGRYNIAGYCDMAFGQNLKLLGHWNVGFGRDNFVDTTSDYSVVGGLRNEIYKSYASAFGRGHVLKMDDASARGRYSETDENYRYVDRVGYGDNDNNRKNIYTLDKDGNGWFRGDVRIGGTNYDDAYSFFTIKEYNSIDELTSNQAAMGDIVKVPHVIASYPANNYADYDLTLFNVYGDSQYESGTHYDRESIKVLVRNDGSGKYFYAYYNVSELTGSAAGNYELKITYFDNGNTRIRIQYRNSALSTSYVDIYRNNTQTWKTETVQLTDLKFNENDSVVTFQGNNDIRVYPLSFTPGDEVYIETVVLYKGSDLYVLTSPETNGYQNIDNWKNLLKNDEFVNHGLSSINYLNSFFKELPEGKSIDDLNTPNDVGCYIYNEIITKTSDVMGTTEEYVSPTLLIVGRHNYDLYDESRVCQTKISCDPMNAFAGNIIQHRTYDSLGGWSYWQHSYNKTYNTGTISTLLSTKCNVGDIVVCNNHNNNIVYSATLGNFDASIGNLKMWTSTTNLDMDCYGEDAVIGGKACRKCGDIKNNTTTEKYKAGRNRMMYFTIPDINAIVNGAIIKFSYYDLGTHAIEIKDAPTASGRRLAAFNLTNTKTWKEKIINVDELYLNKQFNGQDIRFHCASDLTDESTFKNLYISDVTVYVPSSSIENGSEYYKEKEAYMLVKDDYTNIENWIKINK